MKIIKIKKGFRILRSLFLLIYKVIFIKIINIYPPVPTLLDNNQYSKRIEFWEKEYANILSESRYDLSDSIPFENNTNYYYDMVHLNKKGKEIFTKHLAEKLKQVTLPN